MKANEWRLIILGLQVSTKIPEVDKIKLDRKIEDAVSWLDANQLKEVRIQRPQLLG